MYVVPSVKKSPTKQNPSHFRDPYNGLYDMINPKLTSDHFSYWDFGKPPPKPATTIIQSRTFRGPAPEMKVFKADLWEGIFLDLDIGKLSSVCSPRWKGESLFHPPPFWVPNVYGFRSVSNK